MAMKKIIFGVLIVVLGFGFTGKAGASTQDFTISDFQINYVITKTAEGYASAEVTETITAKFPEFDQNHGIYRQIPTSYKGHSLHIAVESVRRTDGSEWNYTSSSQGSGDGAYDELKIGSASTYVHGQQIYIIKYLMDNFITTQTDHQEFYWDIIGNGWQQNIEQAAATINLGPGVAENLQAEKHCFTGAYGSKETDCTLSDSGGIINISANGTIYPGQSLSVVLGLKPGTFTERPKTFAEKYGALIVIGLVVGGNSLPPMIAFVVLYRKWRRVGRDPKGRGVVVPEYQPPKGFSVIESYALYKEFVQPKALTAQIIDLAIKGYVRIIEEKKSGFLASGKKYSLEVIKTPGIEVSDIELQTMKVFFGDASTGAVISLDKYDSNMSTKQTVLKSSIFDKLVSAGYFVSDPSKVMKNYLVFAGVFFVIGIVVSPLIVGLITTSIIFAIFARIMPARTASGVEIFDQLKGLREYINMAEKDQINYLQSPENAEKFPINTGDSKQMVKLFEKLLPYAIVFDLEKKWADKFKDFYTEPPQWYAGSNWAAFNTGMLVSSISSFNTGAVMTSVMAQSSGGGGMGGGGFSGGGGGGGGGGGW